MTNKYYPKTLSEIGVTLEEYNNFDFVLTSYSHSPNDRRLTRDHKITADLWFGSCCNRPIHNFNEIARIRNISPPTATAHIRYVIETLTEYVHKRDKDKLEEDIFKISLALFKHKHLSSFSYSDNIYCDFQYNYS